MPDGHRAAIKTVTLPPGPTEVLASDLYGAADVGDQIVKNLYRHIYPSSAWGYRGK